MEDIKHLPLWASFSYQFTRDFIFKNTLHAKELRILLLLDLHKFARLKDFEEWYVPSAKQKVHGVKKKGYVTATRTHPAIYSLTLDGEVMVERYKEMIKEIVNTQLSKEHEKARHIESKRRADEVFGVSNEKTGK